MQRPVTSKLRANTPETYHNPTLIMSTTTVITTTVTTTPNTASATSATGEHTGRSGRGGRSGITTAVDEPIYRAYAQWVSIKINNNGTVPIQLKNLGVWWGKLYANGQSRPVSV